MSAVLSASKTDRIRHLNDVFRDTFIGGRVVLTEGIASLREEVKSEVLTRVREFKRFSSDNDPHKEHDFGAFEIAGQRYFWKIDYYDKSLEAGSEDPANPEVTTRVLTVMLAEEY